MVGGFARNIFGAPVFGSASPLSRMGNADSVRNDDTRSPSLFMGVSIVRACSSCSCVVRVVWSSQNGF